MVNANEANSAQEAGEKARELAADGGIDWKFADTNGDIEELATS